MNLDNFARFFVRFNGLCFLFWTVHSLVDLPYVYGTYKIVHEVLPITAAGVREFWMLIARVALQLLAAAVLFGRTDEVITLLLTGEWRKPVGHAATGGNEKKA